MKINNIINIGYFLFFIGFLLAILANVYHPLVGDDYNLKFQSQESSNLYTYFLDRYSSWSGRFLQNFFSYFIFKNEIYLFLIKIINIPIFIIIMWLGWYCSTGNFISYKNQNFWKFVSLTGIVWLSIPSISITIIWITGSITYLYSLFFGMLFITPYFYLFNKTENINSNFFQSLSNSIFFIIVGFIAGSSLEQLSVACFIVSLCILINLIFFKKIKIPIYYYLGFIFLIIGIIFLFIAPGNYIRSSFHTEDIFFNQIYKYILYLGSSYYSLGDETAGKLFFISLISLLFIFNPNMKYYRKNIIRSGIFILASISTLIIMLPVINFASTRTTFLAVIFAYFFWISLNYNNENILNTLTENLKKIFIVYTISSLIIIDSLVGYITNKEFSDQSSDRISIINRAESEGKKYIEVPFFSIIPSRLTHMQNPNHDREFLMLLSLEKSMAISHEFNKQSTLPHTKNILKNVKNFFND